MLVLASLVVVGLGLYFVLVRPPLLPEDERYIGAPAGALESAGPHLGGWLGHVSRVMGGFIMAAGALMSYVTAMSFREGRRGAFASDFRWLLVALALPWAVALALWAARR